MIVLLDRGPLGLVTNPKQSQEADACKLWLRGLITAGYRALVPAITDYELRRELALYGKTNGLRRLDQLGMTHGFLLLTDDALRHAAGLWATARRLGLPTADRLALDADVQRRPSSTLRRRSSLARHPLKLFLPLPFAHQSPTPTSRPQLLVHPGTSVPRRRRRSVRFRSRDLLPVQTGNRNRAGSMACQCGYNRRQSMARN